MAQGCFNRDDRDCSCFCDYCVPPTAPKPETDHRNAEIERLTRERVQLRASLRDSEHVINSTIAKNTELRDRLESAEAEVAGLRADVARLADERAVIDRARIVANASIDGPDEDGPAICVWCRRTACAPGCGMNNLRTAIRALDEVRR